MKRIFPMLIAALVFVLAIILMRPERTVPVVIASHDLLSGHLIQLQDLEVRQMPDSLVPAGAFRDPSELAGLTLSVSRTSGDFLYPANMGGEQIVLAKDERAIAIQVSDSAGLAGLLKPGDRVGVTAVIFGPGSGQGAFAKAISGGLRVLYISPDFQALDPMEAIPQDADPGAGTASFATSPVRTRDDKGTVVLAVPTQARSLAYDFAGFRRRERDAPD